MSAALPLPADLYANKGSEVLRIIIAFPILAFIIVSLRLYTRTRIVQLTAIDDWLILAALFFSIGTSIAMAFQVHYGMGRHIETLTPDDAVGSLKALFASIIAYNWGLTFTKLSILFQYLRIAVAKPIRIFCWIFVYFTMLNGIQTFLSGTFTCVPVRYFWNNTISGKCANKPALWFANAGINIVQDIGLILIPLFLIKDLMLPKRQKAVLFVILGLGGFACVTSILRLHALYIVTVSKDISWDDPGTATWSCIELNVGIICASLPTLRALVSKYFPKLLPTRRGGAVVHYHHGSKKLAHKTANSDSYGSERKGSPHSYSHYGPYGRDLEPTYANLEAEAAPQLADPAQQRDLEAQRLANGASAGLSADQRKIVQAFCLAGSHSLPSSQAMSPATSPVPGQHRPTTADPGKPAGIKVVTTTRQVVEYASDESSEFLPRPPTARLPLGDGDRARLVGEWR